MPLPSITHTFVSGTSAQAGQVNTNFSDIIASLTDGTKDLTVNSVTTTGAVSVGGNLTLSANVVGNILPNADATYSLGSTTLGFVDLYLDNGATNGGTIYFDGSNASYLQSNAAGTTLTIAGFTDAVVPAGVSNDIAEARTRATGTTVAVGGVGISVDSGNYTTTSGTFGAVTNLSITITTSGRPVFVGLCTIGTDEGYVSIDGNDDIGDAFQGSLQFKRDSTVISLNSILLAATELTENNSYALRVPVGSFNTIDAVAAGTYTYTCEARADYAPGGSFDVNDASLVVYEL